MGRNGPVQGCTRLGGHVFGPSKVTRTCPHRVPGACGMVQEAPPRAYMVPQACIYVWHTYWGPMALYKVAKGWVGMCRGPSEVTAHAHGAHAKHVVGWVGGWVDGAAHTHTHVCMAHTCKRGSHTHTHHLGVLVGGGGVHACTRVGGACVQSKACAWGKGV